MFGDEGDPVVLVGRSRELAGVRRQLAGGRPLVVTGEPGMGKSAFLGVLARQLAEERGLPVHRVRVADFGLRSDVTLLRLLGACGEAGSRALAEVVGHVPAMVPNAVVHVCRQLFLAHPAVVVVDGVPTGTAADRLLADLVSAFSRTLSFLLVGSADARPPQGAQVALCHLRPLDRADASALILETAGSRGPTAVAELPEELVEAASGNPLLARVVGAQLAAAMESGRLPTVFRLPAPTWMSDEARGLLDSLAALGAEELPADLVHTLGDRPATAVRELCRYELLHPTGEGTLRLHPLIRSLVVRDWSDAELDGRAADAAQALVDAAEENPAAFGDHPAAFVGLVDRAIVANEFVDPLADQLAQRGRLAELLVLRQVLWARTGEVTLEVPLAVATRESGQPELAAALLGAHAPEGDALLEQAVTACQRGLLAEADHHLSTLPSGRGADAWTLLTRATVHCDRGDLRAAGPLLRRAVEAHQVAGDRRGEAWTVFQYGRLCLLRGEVEDAEKLLYSAREAFHAVGEARGVAWAGTELGRLSLQLGLTGPEDLVEEARFLHEAEGDRRGAAWADLWWVLAKVDRFGSTWKNLFPAVTQHFRDVSDRLGQAWALHHHALTLARETGTDEGRNEADLLFDEATQLFEAADCPHGRAWTLLERALHDPSHRFLNHRWAGDVRDSFRVIGDEAGEAWVDLAESAIGTAPPYELARRCPPALLDAVEWTEDGDLLIPRAARYTQPEPRPGTYHPDAARSHVRLTLLDDIPAPDTASRIALKVVPGVHHPWSTGPLPPLTARAVPLTHADIEPLHAISTEAAEFRFTPHRPGRHRIRFTLADQATGTVLQQVETEIDVIASSSPVPRMTAPEPARRA
ncbi:AAA family ATPase [Streptomyces sp. NBC_00203]|uniref:AAA family ATPase n=1 Tax=Streptomyces sp. NBC_00203 TaxID=2975680 RepID=UPI00324E647D